MTKPDFLDFKFYNLVQIKKNNKANKQKKARGQEMTRNDQHSYGKLAVIRFSTPKTCFNCVFEILDFPKNEKKLRSSLFLKS